MWKFLVAAATVMAYGVAAAGGSAAVECAGPNQVQIKINYTPDRDVGTPGLFWVGLVSPDETKVLAMTPDRGWVEYQGGLYPFQGRYDNGLLGTISLKLGIPGGGPTTDGYVGHKIYLGHGAYGQNEQVKVKNRRDVLNSVKPELVARGRWRPEHEDDMQYIYSLVQKNMMDNRKYNAVQTVPFINCEPPPSGY